MKFHFLCPPPVHGVRDFRTSLHQRVSWAKTPEINSNFQSSLVFLTFLCSHQPLCRCIRRVVVLAFGNRKSHPKNMKCTFWNSKANGADGFWPCHFRCRVYYTVFHLRLISNRSSLFVSDTRNGSFSFPHCLQASVPFCAQRTRLVETKTEEIYRMLWCNSRNRHSTSEMKEAERKEKKNRWKQMDGRMAFVHWSGGNKNERIFLLTLLCRTHRTEPEMDEHWTLASMYSY